MNVIQSEHESRVRHGRSAMVVIILLGLFAFSFTASLFSSGSRRDESEIVQAEPAQSPLPAATSKPARPADTAEQLKRSEVDAEFFEAYAGAAPSQAATNDSGTQAIAKEAEIPAEVPIASAQAFAATTIPEPQFRQWQSADGKFTVEARLRAYRDGVVTLEKRNGTPASVPLAKLAVADHQAVAEQIRVETGTRIVLGKVMSVTPERRFVFRAMNMKANEVAFQGLEFPSFTASSEAMQAIIGRQGWIEWSQTDTDGRPLATLYLDGENVNLTLLAKGAARLVDKTAADPRALNAEMLAKKEVVGIWKAE